MHKITKLGIPDSLLIALIFVSGLADSVIMVALAVFVLLYEQEEKVKEAAKNALLLFGLFAILWGGLHTLDYLIRILLSDESGYSNFYNNLSYLLAGAQTVTYLALGGKEALAYMSMRSKGIYVPKAEPAKTAATAQVQDAPPAQTVAQNAAQTVAQPQTQAVAPAPVQQASNVCPQCGSTLDPGVHFCKKCGAKTN